MNIHGFNIKLSYESSLWTASLKMAAERYLSRRIPDLRVGNNIDEIDKKLIPASIHPCFTIRDYLNIYISYFYKLGNSLKKNYLSFRWKKLQKLGIFGIFFTFKICGMLEILVKILRYHTGQCKRTGGCYNELVVAFLRTGDGLKGKKSLPVDFMIYL